jgi:uncharacterized protein
VVESCVNLVGVNLNTASKHLLTYVSPDWDLCWPRMWWTIARKSGALASRREQLMQVAQDGGKGLRAVRRISAASKGADNPLDNSAVHPESYHIVERMASDLKVDLKQLVRDEIAGQAAST